MPAPASSDGVSLLPLLAGRGTRAPGTVYIEYFNNIKSPAYADFSAANRGRTRQQMPTVHAGRYTGVRYAIKSADDDFEIYDVEADPRQARNLAGEPALATGALMAKAKADGNPFLIHHCFYDVHTPH
ncbi:MAG: hypothetical protein H7343_15790 [Undibacterium sp.]|nr:hypothetical protein [Opitutaceae bacterium]